MKQYLRKYTWPLIIVSSVAVSAYLATLYVVGATAQRAARYYDPVHDELHLRILSAAVRFAGTYNHTVVFATLFGLGVLCAVWLAIVMPRLLRWFGWPSHGQTTLNQ